MMPRSSLSRRLVAAFGAAAVVGAGLGCGPPPARAPANKYVDGRDVRDIYKDAVAAFKKGDYPEAQRGFAQVWSVDKKPKVAGNLGRTELKLKKYCGAVEHLTVFLDGQEGLSREERAEVERLRDRARWSTSTLRVEVQPSGAEVFVDETSVGTAPIARDLCVDPGKHRVEARLGDRRAGVDVWAAPNTKIAKKLEVPPKGGAAP